MKPKTKRRNRVRRQLLYAALDFLELPRDEPSFARQGGAAILYAQMLAGQLLRSLANNYKMPKSIKRAKALGIAWHGHTPEHERKLKVPFEKRMGPIPRRRLRSTTRPRWDDDDSDGGVMA